MQNPLRGAYLNNRFYEVVNDTFTFRLPLQNNINRNQNGTFGTPLGGTKFEFTIALMLENTVQVNFGSSIVGVSNWLGVSRLYDLLSFAGAGGVSLPFTFVTPFGSTHSVVPTGELSFAEARTVPRDEGFEFRVDLTLVEV